MVEKLRVMVLFGGRSAEHEISLLSARFIVESLDPDRYELILVGIDKEGRWRLEANDALLGLVGDPRALALSAGRPAVALPPHPAILAKSGAVAGSIQAAAGSVHVEARAPLDVDVVFPILHGPLGEDGTVQGLLELAGLPYVGAGVLGSAVGMDKDVMKRLLAQAGLPILPYVCLRGAQFRADPARALESASGQGFPLFVKPANLGSSVGVSRVERATELESAVALAFEFDDKVVVEQGLVAPREIELAVLGGPVPRVSVPGELVVRHADGFYSYTAKYVDGSNVGMHIPARLSPAETQTAQRLALATFDALEGEGLARVDLFLDGGGRFFVNEINTLPGFTAMSMYPKLMEASGFDARELVNALIDDAIERGARRRKRRTSP